MLNDSELLLGILAVQEEFIGVESLAQALALRHEDESESDELGSILVGLGQISELQRALLQGLVNEQLGLALGDPSNSHASAELLNSVRQALERAQDWQLTDSLHTILISEENDKFHKPSSILKNGDRARFEIIDRHAIGGLGEVFLAKDMEISRKVALKRIRKELSSNENLRTRFFQEAEITGRLEHPGIVPVYALGMDEEGDPYYTMRFIRGDTLEVGIREFHGKEVTRSDFKTVHFRSLLGTMIEVCHAIVYAHSRGVIHRDIKPQNIMVGKYGETLVVDWGLAKALYGAEQIDLAESLLVPDSADGSSPTRIGSAIGTPTYMSPEQASGEVEDVGPSSDVYSIGATLYHVLTGKPPRSGKNLEEMIGQAVDNEFPAPRTLKPEIPRALEAICLKAMSLKPRDRYRSPKQLAADIERYLAGEPVSVYQEPGSQRLSRWLQTHRTLVATSMVAALLLLSAAVVTSMLWQASKEREFERRLEQAQDQVDKLESKAKSRENAALSELQFGRFSVTPIQSGSDSGSGAYLSTTQTLPCLRNQTYRITLRAKAKDLSVDGCVMVVNDQAEAPAISLPPGSYEWREFHAEVSSGDRSNFKLEFRTRDENEVWIDNISAIAVSEAGEGGQQ